jgi:hypothetical protein
MPCLEPSYELAASLLTALYSAKTPEEFRTKKAALRHTMDADLLSCALPEEREEHRGAEHRGGRIMRQAEDMNLAELHAHLRKVCPMHAMRMYVRRPLRKWLQALRERRW